MLEQSKTMKEYYSTDSILKEVKEKYTREGEEVTTTDVLEYLLGNNEDWNGSDYVVYKYNERSDRSFLQRFNMLWIYPLFILTIPFQFLFLGNTGVNRNSKIGKIVDKLVKLE